MPDVELPPGRYLTCAYQVHPEAGGQTRAMLMRNRILALEGGVRPEVLTLVPAPDPARGARRADLRRVPQPARAAPSLAPRPDPGRRSRLRLHRLALRAAAPRAAARPADAAALPGPQPAPQAARTALGRRDPGRVRAGPQARRRRRRLRHP